MERNRAYFNDKEKRELRAEFNNQCGKCFKGPNNGQPLDVHHAIPTAMGGADIIENGLAADRDCHKELDKEAFQKGMYFDKTVGFLVPIEDAPDSMFKTGVNEFREVREGLM